MATFKGTNKNETITPTFVSPSVVTSGGDFPGVGDDTIRAGGGNDTVAGGGGSDSIFLGSGDDLFSWVPGDGSDVIEGQAGDDRLSFAGSGANENIAISANATRTRFFRDVGNVSLDLNSVERLTFHAAAGSDTIAVNDLAGTGVTRVLLDLAAAGTDFGDGATDTVRINARNGKDSISLSSSGTTVKIDGLAWATTVKAAEIADQLVIAGLGGADRINAAALGASVMALTIDGGTGGDSIVGSSNADVILGGDGNDRVSAREATS
jgi:Ca2+-binding RTX toxin-like protein